MRPFLLAVLAVLALLLPVPHAHAQGDETVTVRGFIINRTTGEKAPAGLEVTLEVRLRGETVETRTTSLGESGEFEFRGVPGGDGYRYFVRTRYRDITYEWLALPEFPAQFPIYENTSSPDDLEVRGISLVLVDARPREGFLRFIGLATVVNTGDRNYVPDPSRGSAGLLRFGLPEGYRDLDVRLQRAPARDPIRVDLPDGFVLPVPLSPEEPMDLAYTFLLPYQGGQVSFTQTFPFPTERFLVVVPAEVQVDSAGVLRDQGIQDINGTPFRLYAAQGLEAGDRVTLRFTNLPTYTLADRLRSALDARAVQVGVPAGLVGLALLGLLAYALTRRLRAPAPAPVGEAPPLPQGEAEGAEEAWEEEGGSVRPEAPREESGEGRREAEGGGPS